MKKKLVVFTTTLIFMITVAFAFNYSLSKLKASTGMYATGGKLTGRINKSPSGVAVNNVGMRKGDKLLLGTMNPETGKPITIQLVNNSTYTAYNCPTHTSLCTQAIPITAWFAHTTEAIAHPTTGIQISDFVNYNDSVDSYAPYTSSNFYQIIQALNQNLHSKDLEILTYQNMNYSNNALSVGGITQVNVVGGLKVLEASFNQIGFYMPCSKTLNAIAPKSDRAFEESYWTASFYHGGNVRKYVNYYILSTGGSVAIDSGLDTNSGLQSEGRTYALRAYADIDTGKVVFAVSPGTSSELSQVTVPTLTSGYSSIVEDVKGEAMKIRIENPALTASTIFTQIENDFHQAISKVVVDESVLLKANAQSGTDSDGGVYTVSALIFNNNGDFLYYIPIEPAKGNGTYKLDLTGIPVGKYKIGIVNEAYNDSSTAPADSSLITDVKPLEIVLPHKLTYTKTPQSGASSGNDYEFSKNVNAGQTVGKITVNPQGVMPLSYTVETNGDNTYQNFEIDGLDSNNASSSTSLNVKIKSGAPDLVNGGLKTGAYKFCITAVDANGDPVDSNGKPTQKVCTSFTVAKTNPTIAFDDSNQTKKSVADAATSWNETATATPSTGTKITYSVSGGDAYLIDIDKDTGKITYKGNGGYGKVKIKATVDDDPSSGNDNYNSAFVEKEIVIYREVDGSVTPHSNSSSTTTPTFTASDSNVKTNGIIATIKGTLGTPDTIGGTTITYKYGLKTGGDSSLFSVDQNTGVIKAAANLGVGSYHITVTVSDKWSTKEISVTINVGVAAAEDLKFYENSTSNMAITSKSVKATDTNVSVYATVKGSTNNNPVKYKIKDGSTNIIEVNENSGAITIHGVGTVTIVAEKQGASGQANAQAELTFTVTAGEQEFIYTDSGGNELPKTGELYKAYEEVYEKNKTFQLYTAGNPTGSTVTYKLKNGSPTDVISVDSNGLVHILNASLNTQMGKVIVEATSHDPSGNYSDKTIELPINIKKADQTISFADVTYATNGSGKVTPVINEKDISSNDGGVQVNDTDYYITIDSSISTSIAWTNNGVDIEYNYSGNGIDIPLHVEKAGNRNYNKAEANGTMHIMGPDENTLAINRPGKIIYGDHFEIRSLQDDSSSINVKYTFEVDNTTYISNPTVNGNKAEFDALKVSGSTSINIKVTRTADGEVPLSKTISVQVLPKPIEIIIDDKEKLKGEVNPTQTYQDFKNQLVSWNGVQDVIQENDIKLSTTAKTDSAAGSYPIKGDANTLNKTYPNYSFTFKEGTLSIKEENIEDDWYHLELDDGNNTLYTGNWTNKDVNIISDHLEYINLSLDQSTWKPSYVTVSKEGETNQSFWMKKDSGAITKEKQELIKIDKTAPKVKGIKAKDTNNKFQDIINKLSGGIFFKPGTAFEITTSDSKDDLKVSGTKEITYKVYKVDKTGEAADELIKDGSLTVSNEKASITISELTGTYKVCVIPTDNAENTGNESCHEVELKKIGVDVDSDGEPDFNDPDGDGCPDLNIKWKDPNDESKWIVINGDRNNDGIPDLNIDSDGDGKPDLNIDTDKDGKPDLNLVILKKSDWKPTKCVKTDIDNEILEEYCTGTSVKAVINVDTDGDYVPNINIDNKGDFKPHLNIAKDGSTEPYLNIILPQHTWEPIKDYKNGSFTYDSIGKHDPLINIDTDGDGLPDVNIDLDGDLEPDINIDIDGDLIPDIDIDSTGDGIPDINVDTDGDGKPDDNIIEITDWKPNKNVDGDSPYDTMDFNEMNKPTEPNDKTDTSVKGQYNPETSMGGANTGDNTQLILYIGISCIAAATILYMIYKRKVNI